MSDADLAPSLERIELDPDKVADIDLASEDLRQNFTQVLAEWAKRPPFYVRFGAVPQLVCARYQDVMEVYLDRERFSVEPPKGPGRFDRFMGVQALTQLDGDRHDRLRRLMGPTFSPVSVQNLIPAITRVVDGLLDAIEAKGEAFDAMGDFASHLVVRVLLGEMLGMSEDRKRAFMGASDAIATLTHLKPGEPPPPDCVKAFDEARRTVDELIAERRDSPGDDLISGLIAARDEGDKLGDTELFDQIFVICAAALNSTASAMGGVLLCLGRDPGQFDAVKRDHSLIPAAVEECLRYHGPGFLSFARFATVDGEVGGVKVFKGMPVICSQQAACYDPEQFPDPLRFDIRRDPKNIPIFGGGVHHCMGNRLARLILQTSLARLMDRFPGIRLADPDFKPSYQGEVSETMLVALPMRIG